MQIVLRFDLRSLPGGPSHSELYQAALDTCEWAERLDMGPVAISVGEHHGSADGYLSSPFVLAAAIAGRTKRAQIAIAALLMPLHHPLRLAEDIAALDLVSQGRASVILGAGYRYEEFAMFGVDITRRGELMEAGVQTLKDAWTGEPFEFRGQIVRVTPRPHQRPRPPILLAGSSIAAAKRAARIADGFVPSSADLVTVYRDECQRLGKIAGPASTASGPGPISLVHDDPDAGWKLISDACLHDMSTYADWIRDGRGASGPHFHVADADALRATGRYTVLTPQQCIEQSRRTGALMLDPLIGGIDPVVARAGLELIEREVVPALRSAADDASVGSPDRQGR